MQNENIYEDDYFIRNVKSCVPVTYDEVAEEFALADGHAHIPDGGGLEGAVRLIGMGHVF